MENILRYDMELERMHAGKEDRGVIWIKYFAKVESRNREKYLAFCDWRVYFLMEVQSNAGYGNVCDIWRYNFDSRTFVLILCW